MDTNTSGSTIPVPQQTQNGLNFPEALDAIILEDATITKLEWNDDGAYGALRDGILMLRRDGKWFKWIINDGDLFGDDWVVRNKHI